MPSGASQAIRAVAISGVMLLLAGTILAAQLLGLRGSNERKLISFLTSRMLAVQRSEDSQGQSQSQGQGPAVSWQEDVMHQALKAASSRDALQLLVIAAGNEQREGGKTPSVLVTIADSSGVNILMPLFVETLHAASPALAASTVVITVSEDAYNACRQHKWLCFYNVEAEQRNVIYERKHPTIATTPRNRSPQFLQIGWDKLARLQDSLATDSNILFADMDIIWLKDPLAVLEAEQSDVQLTHAGQEWQINIGVMFIRPTECTGTFMRDWLARRTQPDSRDQYEFPEAVKSATAKCPAFKVTMLPQTRFPNCCCCGLDPPNSTADGEQWVLWHAACGGDVHERKKSLENIVRQSKQRLPVDRRCWRSQ